MILLNAIILAVHIFFAILFVGGSFFMWLVVWPASYELTDDEKYRTRIVGRIAKKFAMFTHISVIVLIITGIYNTTWYLGSYSALFNTVGGNILLGKIVIVGIDLLIIYTNNIYHGRKIMRLSREGKIEEMQEIRKVTHLFSFISLALLLLIVFLATLLQFY